MKIVFRFLYRVLFILFLVFGAVYLFGPDEQMTGEIVFNPSNIGDDAELYLTERESAYSDIRTGLQKEIIWQDEATKGKTAYSVIYLHGYTASKEEIRPVPDRTAEHLGANLFYARFKGHGRTSDAMAEVTVDGWLNDAAEAIAVGAATGDKVVVIATSTGAAIVTWLAANKPELVSSVAAFVFVSPNYGIHPPADFVLRFPLARTFVPLFFGKERLVERETEAERHAWTTPYASVSLAPMAKIMEEGRETNVGAINIPALFIFSPNDQVVNPENTRNVMSRWGGETEAMEVTDSTDDSEHVIAGDLRSPNTTDKVVERVNEWLEETFTNP